MKITQLVLWNCGAADDLRSLQGIQMKVLIISYLPALRDLTPLTGMGITELYMDHCVQVSDLSPLKGLPLTKLNIKGCDQITDLSPLKDLPLTEIDCNFKPERDGKNLGAIKTLVEINGIPVAEALPKEGKKDNPEDPFQKGSVWVGLENGTVLTLIVIERKGTKG